MEKRFLFISIEGLLCDIAWVIAKEGNQVKVYISDENSADIGTGFVDRINKWEDWVDWADVIVFDDTLGQGTIAEDLRKKGKLVIGGTAYTDRLEDDRSFGQEEMKKHGISIIPYQIFSSFDQAIDFVKNNAGRYVIKSSGESHVSKSFLFIGEEEDGQDVLHMLEAYKKVFSDKVAELQLQKRVVGVEVAIGAFFNGHKFLDPINVNFEHKKLFPGNLGPSTGEMGTSMFWSQPNKIFNATLKKLEPKLAEEHFVGYIDINCIVNGNGIYPLEFTSRFGYPTIFIQQEGISMPMGEFFYKMAAGEDFVIKTKKGFQIGVRVIVPPYPFDDPATFDSFSKNAVILFRKPNHDGVHFEDAKMEKGEWLVAGEAGVVLTITGSGLTMKQAQKQVYHRVSNLMIPNMYYRTDIGDRWYEDSDKLNTWSYLRDS